MPKDQTSRYTGFFFQTTSQSLSKCTLRPIMMPSRHNNDKSEGYVICDDWNKRLPHRDWRVDGRSLITLFCLMFSHSTVFLFIKKQTIISKSTVLAVLQISTRNINTSLYHMYPPHTGEWMSAGNASPSYFSYIGNLLGFLSPSLCVTLNT